MGKRKPRLDVLRTIVVHPWKRLMETRERGDAESGRALSEREDQRGSLLSKFYSNKLRSVCREWIN